MASDGFGSGSSARIIARDRSSYRVCLPYPLGALLWIDSAQLLDDFEMTVPGLGYVHVHSNVMLTGNHFGATTWPLCYPGMVQCFDNLFLLQRTGLSHSSFPEFKTSIQT